MSSHARSYESKETDLTGTACPLGPDADHNLLGRATIALNNRLGVMSNQHDTAAALDAELGRHFSSHKLELFGTVALFSGRLD